MFVLKLLVLLSALLHLLLQLLTLLRQLLHHLVAESITLIYGESW